jgi:hypothetical protein
MTNMSLGDALKMIDHAAAMNDRWMFVASLVVIGMFGIWVVRYFVKQHEGLLSDHKKAREMYQESLRGVVAEQSATNAKLIACLDNNTRVLRACKVALKGSGNNRKEK